MAKMPLKELHVGGKLPEDRIIWKGEVQRHCEEENEDVEETIEVQEDRIKMYKADGNGHFTKDMRVPDMTEDLVLQARAKVADE